MHPRNTKLHSNVCEVAPLFVALSWGGNEDGRYSVGGLLIFIGCFLSPLTMITKVCHLDGNLALVPYLILVSSRGSNSSANSMHGTSSILIEKIMANKSCFCFCFLMNL